LAGYGWRASSDAQIKEIIDMAGVQLIQVDPDEAGMRLDRWFKIHFPGLGFGQLQKLLRSGQIRVDGGRVKTDARVAARPDGQGAAAWRR
jgi:23S rRNA-/tRNA-specific pseudouridylate synthase